LFLTIENWPAPNRDEVMNNNANNTTVQQQYLI